MALSRNKLRKLFTRAHRAHQRGELHEALAGYQAIFAKSPELNRFLGKVGEALATSDPSELGQSLRSTLSRLDETYAAALHYGAIAARQLHGAMREIGETTPDKLAMIDNFSERLMALSVIVAPENASALFNYGKARQDKGDLTAALKIFRTAAHYAPSDAHIWAKLGDCLMETGDERNALAAWRRAMETPPTAADTAYNLSFLYLLLGDFERGLVLHEMRWECPDFVHANGRKALTAPLVRYGEDVAGKRVLVRHEQGNGDQIMMARFIRNLVAAGATVVVETLPGLVELMRAAYPTLEVVGLGDEIPAHDCQIPFMSLAWHYVKHESDIPAPLALPELAPTGKLASLVAHLRTIPGRKVGIAWAGSPKHVNDAKRSAPAAFLEALANVPGVTWVNLQVGTRSDEFSLLGDSRVNAARALRTFTDTAALMQRLDAVVTVDTGVAHLAGSVGVPASIVLPYNAEWRWMRSRADSPWYPAARLVRQPRPGDWLAVAEELRATLRVEEAA